MIQLSVPEQISRADSIHSIAVQLSLRCMAPGWASSEHRVLAYNKAFRIMGIDATMNVSEGIDGPKSRLALEFVQAAQAFWPLGKFEYEIAELCSLLGKYAGKLESW